MHVSAAKYCARRKTVVEDCIKLSVFDLHRVGVFTKGFRDAWISWVSDGLRQKVEFSALEWPGQAMILRFDDPRVRCVIGVSTTPQHFGGRRFWFRCPVVTSRSVGLEI
jgi:hypothetical protein